MNLEFNRQMNNWAEIDPCGREAGGSVTAVICDSQSRRWSSGVDQTFTDWRVLLVTSGQWTLSPSVAQAVTNKRPGCGDIGQWEDGQLGDGSDSPGDGVRDQA